MKTSSAWLQLACGANRSHPADPVHTRAGRAARTALLAVLLLALTFHATPGLAGIIWQENCETTAVGNIPTNMIPNSHGSQNIFAVVASPARAGSRAMHLKLQYVDTTSYRAEVTTQNPRVNYQYDTEYWMGYSQYLKDWVTDTRSEMVLQAHSSAPTITTPENCYGPADAYAGEIINGDFKLRVDQPIENYCNIPNTSSMPNTVAWTGSVSNQLLNRWVDWVLHFKFSNNGAGYYEVWRDGTQVVSIHGINNAPLFMHPCCTPIASNYLYYFPKWGVYKWDWQTVAPVGFTSREMYIDELKIWEGPGGTYASVDPGGGAPTTPAAPSGVTAIAVSSSQINLSWSDNASNETGFKIERKTGSGGTYTQIATVDTNVTIYQDTGLSASLTYYYRVRATNATGNSTYSNEANATPLSPPILMSPSLSGNQFAVSVQTVAAPVVYYLEYKTNLSDVGWTPVTGASVVGDGAVHVLTDAPLTGSQRFYRVRVTILPTSGEAGLAAWYRFDEANGTTASDSSGSNNVATMYNGVTWTTGTNANAVSLDGINDYVLAPSSASFNTIAGQLTVATWVYKRANAPGVGGIVGRRKGASGLDSWILYYANTTNDEYSAIAATAAGTYALTGPASTGDQNVWVHLAMVYTEGNLLLYRNGVQAGSVAASGAIATETSGVIMGAGDNGTSGIGEFINAKLDNVRVYNRALRQAEIQSLYNNGQ